MEKQRWEESEERREEERRSGKRKSQKTEDTGARKGSKVAKHCVFPMICASGGSKSRLAKSGGCGDIWRCRKSARCCGAKHISKSTCSKNTRFGPLLEVAMSIKCTPLWREEHLQVKQLKTLHVRTTFGSWDVEKVHAVVVRSTCPSQNVKSTNVRTTFGRSDVVLRGRCRGLCTLSKVSKM